MRYPVLNAANGVLTWARQLVNGLERDYRAPLNGTVTLTAGATSTTVSAAGILPGGRVFLSPESSDAVTIAGPHVPEEDINEGSFVARHSNNASTDRKYYWRYEVQA